MRHFILALLLFPALAWAQMPVAGQWKGTVVQDPGGIDNRYYYTLTLNKTSETTFTGTSRITPMNGADHLGVMRLRATLKGDILSIEEYAIDTSRIREGYEWCVKRFEVRVVRDGDSLRITGICKGNTLDKRPCSDATFKLASFQPEIPKEVLGRYVKSGQEMHVAGRKLTLEIYDDRVVDGDRISINFNGTWIIKNRKLKKKPYTLEITLREVGGNYLVLHAENLGKEPPNTAAVRVRDARGSHKITLSSDLESSDYVRFVISE